MDIPADLRSELNFYNDSKKRYVPAASVFVIPATNKRCLIKAAETKLFSKAMMKIAEEKK